MIATIEQVTSDFCRNYMKFANSDTSLEFSSKEVPYRTCSLHSKHCDIVVNREFSESAEPTNLLIPSPNEVLPVISLSITIILLSSDIITP